ncbi:hypothetical protein M2418_004442 [Rhizobium sp. BIGb0125]|jgi:hypothetical protein|nr:hypothetical protein [Rhizobium sp. BIGb0125]
MELSQAGHEIKNFGFRRVVTGVVFFGCFDDKVYDGRKTAAAATPFFHRVVHFCRYDKLPTVFVQELVNDVPDVVVSDIIAATNKHGEVRPYYATYCFCT